MGRHLQEQDALYLDKQGNCNVVLGDAYAVFLRLNRKTVYDLARQGKIPVRRVGRSSRASRESLMRWLTEGPAPRDTHRTRRVRASRASG